jgi:hypothetical protein
MILSKETILEIEERSNRSTSIENRIWKRIGTNQSYYRHHSYIMYLILYAYTFTLILFLLKLLLLMS